MSIISYKDMKEKKGRILNFLVEIAGIVDELNEMGLTVNGSALLDLKEKLENDNFKVLVIGEFKNGKSTFINSLMGEKVLPAYSTPCTAVINEVIYGKEKKAMLYFKNPLPEEMSTDIQPMALQHIKRFEGKEIPPVELDVADLVDYVAIPDPTKDQADSIKELPYSKVTLEYPIELCHDGIEIIDSPGLNENGTRTKVTEEYLNQADAIVFVFRCPKIAGASEVDYITDQIHTRGYHDIFFVCNAINQIPEEEQDRLVCFGNKKLSPLTTLGEAGIFYVDALGALKAKQNKDNAFFAKTGMKKFEEGLSEYLRNNKGKAKLVQILEPCNTFINNLQKQHIESYIASLDQNVADAEKKIKDAMPKLDWAEKRKDVVEQRINNAVWDLQKEIKELMNNQYGDILSKVPKVVDDLDLENYMTANPFKHKSQKDALEKEVTLKLEQFVQKEMGNWIKTDLKLTIDSFVDQLEEKLGEEIDIFYENLDEFRCEVTGVKKLKDISRFERVFATVFGTITGGPVYGMVGASLGFGEVVKRSAIGVGASLATGAALLATPAGMTTIVVATATSIIGSGVLQLTSAGETLTNKYKKELAKNFIESIKDIREDSCKKYAENISEDIKQKFDLVKKALDNEVQMEKSKIIALNKDKENSKEDRKKKIIKLKKFKEELFRIHESLMKLEKSIS